LWYKNQKNFPFNLFHFFRSYFCKCCKVEGIIFQNGNTYKLIPNIKYKDIPQNLLTQKNIYYKDNYFYVYTLTKSSLNSVELIFSFDIKDLRNKIIGSAVSFSLPLLTLQIFFTMLFYYSMKYTYVKPLEKLAEQNK